MGVPNKKAAALHRRVLEQRAVVARLKKGDLWRAALKELNRLERELATLTKA